MGDLKLVYEKIEARLDSERNKLINSAENDSDFVFRYRLGVVWGFTHSLEIVKEQIGDNNDTYSSSD